MTWFVNAVAFVFLCILTLPLSGPSVEKRHGPHERRVEKNIIISAEYPKIRIRIAETFCFVGSHPIRIRDIAEGERFVFAETDGKQIRRLFIAQFEEFLPTSDEIYRYSFDTARTLGGHRFRHNTFAFSMAENEKENPGAESAATAAFLRSKGYVFEDELIVSRFLTLGGPDRKHELILFYCENASTTGRALKDFYAGDDATEVFAAIAPGLEARSLEAFAILE
jgi:hypothetical protein